MKTLIFGLIIGAACGYFWGYGEARAGKQHIAQRALNKFGVAAVEQESRRRDAAVDTAASNR